MSVMNKRKAFFIECYANYRPMIYKIIYSKLGDRHSAEDLTQDVFCRFFCSLEKINNCSARSWLITASRNVLYEHYRKLEHRPENIEDLVKVEDDTLAYNNSDYDLDIILKDIKQSLRELDRRILDYVIMQNRTYDETAQHLGLTSRNIRYRVNLIHRYITDYFSRHGIKDLSEFLNFFISFQFFLSFMSP